MTLSIALTDALVVDSVTHLDLQASGRVIVCGSHAGAYVAVRAAASRVAAIVIHDAGVGRERAGVAGLPLLDEAGIAAVAVDSASARIGDARDTADRGVISVCNQLAAELGCATGMSVSAACEHLSARAGHPGATLPPVSEEAVLLCGPPGETWALDSVSLVGPEHARSVVVTGSHGGLLGGRPETALKYDALGAVFNDAGGGMEDAGLGRLSALSERGIPAAVVDCESARIGDGRSTYEDGVLSAMNDDATAIGATVGIGTRDFVALIHESGLGR